MTRCEPWLPPEFARIGLVLALALSAGLALALEINFTAVAPDIYAYIGDTGGRTYDNEALNANIGLVVTPEGALLIDSGASWQGAQKIAAAVRKVTAQPIRWVINTGGQDHRWLGNGYFKTQGAEIIAHIAAESDMRARGPELLQANAAVLKEKLAGTEIVLPNRWVEGPETILDCGGIRVHVLHAGGGHTPGDSLVWLPHSGVVFTGDIVYVDRILGLHPVSKTQQWLQSFERLESLQPQVIVPGHGRVTTLIQAQRETGALLRALRSHMGKALAAGMDLETAVKTFDGADFLYLRHAEVWLPQLAQRTYLEMEWE